MEMNDTVKNHWPFIFDSLDASTCMMSEWITWSPCSVSCGMGSRSRERYVKQFPDDGSVCTLPTEETEDCVVNEECCEFSLFLLSHTIDLMYSK